jgi:DNA replication regulator DPB11
MGAVNQLDLTSDVTHLIVGELNTPKYKYVAKERPDVKVLDRGWVEAVRQSWIEGGETDVRMLEQKHRLPVFSGLKICFTGVEDGRYLLQFIVADGAHRSLHS